MASPCHRAIGSGAIGWALGVASVALAVVFGAGSFVAAAVVVVMGSSWTASLASMPQWHDHMLTNESSCFGAAGSGWPAAGPRPRTRPGCPARGPGWRSRRRSRRRPAVAVRALGEQLQELLQFCLGSHHEAGLGQLLLQSGLLLVEPVDLGVPRIRPASSPRLGQRGQRAGVPGSSPVHDVAGVQAFPAQDRALLAWIR